MIKEFVYAGAAAALLLTAMPAAADPAKDYRVSYVAERGHYCITPLAESEAERLGIALYRTECHSLTAWATMGVKLSRG